jgi:2-iminobutanoate/2-iminopropanoate deaminase
MWLSPSISAALMGALLWTGALDAQTAPRQAGPLVHTAGAVFALGWASATSLAAQQPGPVQYIAPNASAPFSHVVRAGNTVYLSGMLGTAPGGELAPGGIQLETRQTLENIRTALERVGATMDDLVKCTVFLADMAEWAKMNEVYVTFFPNHRPARTAVGVNGLARDARIEIECNAVIGAREAASTTGN